MVAIGDKVVLFNSKDKQFIEESAIPVVGDIGTIINTPTFNCFLPKTSVEVGDTCKIFNSKDKYFARGSTEQFKYWNPIQDTFTHSWYPDISYGNENYLEIGSPGIFFQDPTWCSKYVYIQYPELPTNINVEKASHIYFQRCVFWRAMWYDYNWIRITETANYPNWDGNTLTWNNQASYITPIANSTILAYFAPGGASWGWYPYCCYNADITAWFKSSFDTTELKAGKKTFQLSTRKVVEKMRSLEYPFNTRFVFQYGEGTPPSC